MKNAADIITSLGGTTAVAEEIGTSPSTVSTWKARGDIPRWWMPSILAFAQRKGIKLEKTEQGA